MCLCCSICWKHNFQNVKTKTHKNNSCVFSPTYKCFKLQTFKFQMFIFWKNNKITIVRNSNNSTVQNVKLSCSTFQQFNISHFQNFKFPESCVGLFVTLCTDWILKKHTKHIFCTQILSIRKFNICTQILSYFDKRFQLLIPQPVQSPWYLTRSEFRNSPGALTISQSKGPGDGGALTI